MRKVILLGLLIFIIMLIFIGIYLKIDCLDNNSKFYSTECNNLLSLEDIKIICDPKIENGSQVNLLNENAGLVLQEGEKSRCIYTYFFRNTDDLVYLGVLDFDSIKNAEAYFAKDNIRVNPEQTEELIQRGITLNESIAIGNSGRLYKFKSIKDDAFAPSISYTNSIEFLKKNKVVSLVISSSINESRLICDLNETKQLANLINSRI